MLSKLDSSLFFIIKKSQVTYIMKEIIFLSKLTFKNRTSFPL